MSDLQSVGSLAPQVAIVALFLWYLVKKDKVVDRLAKAVSELSQSIKSLDDRLESLEKSQKTNN